MLPEQKLISLLFTKSWNDYDNNVLVEEPYKSETASMDTTAAATTTATTDTTTDTTTITEEAATTSSVGEQND